MHAPDAMKANKGWFTFSTAGESFGVYAFAGKEAVNAPFSFEIELVSRSADITLNSLLGAEASLSIADKSGGCRYVHGLIQDMSQLHTANIHTHYRCVLAPRLGFQKFISNNRLFQHLSVVAIITSILKEQGFTEEMYAFKLADTYSDREYCVQYGESNLHFISRLCEEEGIYFYFEHTASGHCLCFTDREGGPKIPGESTIRFLPTAGSVPVSAVVHRAGVKETASFNAAAYTEWNFEKPKLDLGAAARAGDSSPGPDMHLENYQFPHLYSLQEPGRRYADLDVLRQTAFCTMLSCESNVSRYTPGFTFSLFDHPRHAANMAWWVYSVSHKGEQPAVLEQEAPEERGFSYQSCVEAIPASVRFVPGINHPKNKCNAPQSAIVTGPAGEEIYPDKYGRVKVQFHWDREGQFNEHTTCWVRVSDRWAGEDFGSIQCPRIGQEVMVEFMEGDPDRPIIKGRVYNKEKMPPWHLPSGKTLSGIKSREIKDGRRNQLVFDDTENSVHAQLASGHETSQLNLGHSTRISQQEGRQEFRGEGFELRTDAWGAVRAARGVFIGTDPREKGKSSQKDILEATNGINSAASQHSEITNLAIAHAAQNSSGNGTDVAKSLVRQQRAIAGTGELHGEFAEPHLLLSSPAGVAMTTAGSLHSQSDEHTGITVGEHLSQCAGKSILASALGTVSLFAQKCGIRLIAAEGKISIEAQENDLEMIAQKVASYICAKGPIRISSPKLIQLSAGGSFIRISPKGVTKGTSGSWVVHSRSQKAKGPMETEWVHDTWVYSEMPTYQKVVVYDELGRVVNLDRYAVNDSHVIQSGSSEQELVLFHKVGANQRESSLEHVDGKKVILAKGPVVKLSNKFNND